jgi:hypothetical protein
MMSRASNSIYGTSDNNKDHEFCLKQFKNLSKTKFVLGIEELGWTGINHYQIDPKKDDIV